MVEDKPKRDPVELFIRRMRATLKSLEVLERPELLGATEAIEHPLSVAKDSVAIMHAYNKKYQASLAELDAQIAANPSTAEPLKTKKEHLESEAATYYARETPRLARDLKSLSELLLTEYAIELDKKEGTIIRPQEEKDARASYREGFAETDEFDQPAKKKRTHTDREIDRWSDYVFEYEDRIYKMFLPDSSVLFRLNDVPQHYVQMVKILSAIDFLESVSDHTMEMASAMRDAKRPGKTSL